MGVLGLAGLALGQATTNPTAPKADAKAAPWRSMGKSDAAWQRAGWWNDAVFYQIFVRSFKDADPARSPGPLAGDGIGDFRGMIEKLDYLNDGNPETTTDLGVTGLWLMPIHPSPGYHGYEVADFYDVNPQFGSMDDFRAFMKEAHKRGIRVILDLVLNHISYTHPWFQEASKDPKSKYRDWFIWADKVPEWKGPWNQQVWWRQGSALGQTLKPVNPGDTDGPFYYGIFYLSMPDINYRNEQASRAMLDAVRFWLEKENVDGYRLDAIRHLVETGNLQENTPETHAWLQRFHKEYKSARPDAFTIGEVWAPTDQIVPYVGDQLDTCFEFDLSYAMIDAARDGKAERVIAQQKRVLELLPQNQYGRFLSNHDQTRVMTSLKGDPAAMRMAATMLLLGPGVPFIYYGEELGLMGDKPDPNLRTPMQWSGQPGAGFTTGKPWSEPQPGWESQNVEALSRAPRSLLNEYRALIHLRRSSPALSWGGTTLIEANRPEIYAYIRHADPAELPAEGRPAGAAESVLVVMNLGNQPIGEYGLSVGGSPLRGDLRGQELLSGAGAIAPVKAGEKGALDGYRPIPRLEPRTAYVIRLTR